jgi:hypothetical protein
MKRKALPGAAFYVPQDKLTRCKRCGYYGVVWVQSTKTGKWYLCNTVLSQSDEKASLGVHYAEPWNPHKCERSIPE